jgi:hypothetical protein
MQKFYAHPIRLSRPICALPYSIYCGVRPVEAEPSSIGRPRLSPNSEKRSPHASQRYGKMPNALINGSSPLRCERNTYADPHFGQLFLRSAVNTFLMAVVPPKSREVRINRRSSGRKRVLHGKKDGQAASLCNEGKTENRNGADEADPKDHPGFGLLPAQYTCFAPFSTLFTHC